MRIQDNPFTTETFINIWLKHFYSAQKELRYPSIPDLLFVKHRFFNLNYNVGKTHTKGMSYNGSKLNPKDLGNNVLLIFDVPEYFENATDSKGERNLIRITQYPGYLINLKGIDSLESYMQQTFSKSSRYKLRKYRKRLERSFDIRYEMHTGKMQYEKYEDIFKVFRELLLKRFDQKEVTNNNLDPKEWGFYKEVAYPMICEGKAGLFVIYAGQAPIAITLVYFSQRVVFDAITVFDIDYRKFHPGSVNIMGLIEWCIKNHMEILDFSKGHFDYKERWANKNYNFQYHIYYNRQSLGSRLSAGLFTAYFKGKQSLRKRRLNEKLHRLTYKIKTPAKSRSRPQSAYSVKDLCKDEPFGKIVTKESEEYGKVVSAINDALYLTGDHIDNIALYKDPKSNNGYCIIGPNTSKAIMFHPAPTKNNPL